MELARNMWQSVGDVPQTMGKMNLEPRHGLRKHWRNMGMNVVKEGEYERHEEMFSYYVMIFFPIMPGVN